MKPIDHNSPRLQLIHDHASTLRKSVREIVGELVSDQQIDAIVVAMSQWLEDRLDEIVRAISSGPPVATPRDAADDAPAPMMRVDEVAGRWGVNVKTIYGMIERGELPARRFGRVLRVPRHVMVAFEQASVAPGGQKPCR